MSDLKGLPVGLCCGLMDLRGICNWYCTDCVLHKVVQADKSSKERVRRGSPELLGLSTY